MSRSYKKTPRCGDKKNRFFKRCASKAVRKTNYNKALQHKAYKKAYGSYNICDYEEVGTTYQNYLKRCFWLYNKLLEDNKKTYQDYLRHYIRK